MQPADLPPRTIRLPIKAKYERLIPHEKDVEARINDGPVKDVRAGDVLILGRTCVEVLARHEFPGFPEMLCTLGVKRALPMLRSKSIKEATRIYHGFRGYERKAKEHGVVAFEIQQYDPAKKRLIKLSTHQQRAVDFGKAAIDRSVQVQVATSESECDKARQSCYEENRILMIDGPPGTGKTFVQHLLIEYALEQGGRVLLALPNAQLASRQREKFKDRVDIDTCHAAFGDGTDGIPRDQAMLPYSLVLVDEIYQLNQDMFRHINDLHKACERVAALVLAGDKYQMGCPSGDSLTTSTFFKSQVFTTKLIQDPNLIQRCKDPEHQRLLNVLRVGKPSARGGKGLTASLWNHSRHCDYH